MKKILAYVISLFMAVTLFTPVAVHAEEEDTSISNDFYSYYLPDYDDVGDAYSVQLTEGFKAQLNKESGGSFTGTDAEGKVITWKTGDPLPNPAPNGMYDGKKVTDMESMFRGCSELKSLNVSEFDTRNVMNMDWMFGDCSSLKELDLSRFNTSNVNNMSTMFEGCEELAKLDVSGFNTSNVEDMSNMFYGCEELAKLDVSHFNTKNVMNMDSMFVGCNNLTSLDLSHFNTSNVTSMFSMFMGCWELTNLNINSFDTKNVADMGQMFMECKNLTSLDVSGFNTSNVNDMFSMFNGCEELAKLDVSHFDTKNVTNMELMFHDCSSLKELDLSGFNTSNVNDMSTMFEGCEELAKLDVSHFDTKNVTNMRWMFFDCSSLKELDVSNFNTEKVTNMRSMFSGCVQLTSLNLGQFNTSKVTNMREMFRTCYALRSLDLSSFDFTAANKTVTDEYDESYNGLTQLLDETAVNSDSIVIGYAKHQTIADLLNDKDKTGIDTNHLKFYVKGNEPTTIPAAGISLDRKKLDLTLNDSESGSGDLVATITPQNATDKSVKWTSSDEKVATVDENGHVKAVGKGTATITALSNADKDIKATCAVIVKEKEPTKPDQPTNPTTPTTPSTPSNTNTNTTTTPANNQSSNTKTETTKPAADNSQETAIASITNSMTKIKSDRDQTGSVYDKLALKATKTTKNSVALKWKSVSNASKYLVYGAKKGSKYSLLTTTSAKSYTNKKLKKGTYYKYIVIAVDGTGKKLSTSKVVLATTTGGKTKNPTSIKVNKSKVTLKKNKSFKIKAKLNGKKLKTYKKIAYESSNTKVATVSKSGKITAKKKGKATIYVYGQNGVNKTIKVTVK